MIFIGGFIGFEEGKNAKTGTTIIYDSTKDSFEDGPELKKARASFAVGVFKSSFYRSNLLMVAGGAGGGNNVEFMDFEYDFEAGWSKGMSFF